MKAAKTGGLRAGVLAAALAVAAACLGCQAQPPLDVYGRAPDFQLTDQTG